MNTTAWLLPLLAGIPIGLTVGLIGLSVGVFFWGLGLPYPLIKGLWGY